MTLVPHTELVETVLDQALTANSTKIAFTIAHDAGFSIFRLESGERLGTSSTLPLRFASMIRETRYMGVASLFGSGPRLATFDVAIFDSNSKETLVAIDDIRHVRTVQFAEDCMIAVCRGATYFYNMETFEKVSFLETALNEHGLSSVGATKVATTSPVLHDDMLTRFAGCDTRPHRWSGPGC